MHTVNDTQRSLEQAIGRVLKPLGYRKRASTWRRERDAVVSVLNLQKSQWGDDWYMNLGVYLKALGAEADPPEYRCHVRCRAATLGKREMPRDPDGLATLTQDVAVPWLEALSTTQGIAAFLSSDESRVCTVSARVAEVLAPTSGAPPA